MNSAQIPIGHLAYRWLRTQFLTARGLEAGVRLGERAEDLHDMRVAIRRFRAAASLFEDFLPKRFLALDHGLRDLADILGTVRDLDVQLERISDWQESEERFGDVLAELTHRREAARARMLRFFDSARYRRLLVAAEALLAKERVRSPGRIPTAFAIPDLIRERHRRYVRRAKSLKPGDSPKAFHRARVEGKRLRYAVELVSEVYAPEATRYYRRLSVVQDVLGKLQDGAAAAETLAKIEPKVGKDLVKDLAERYDGRAEKLRRKFPKAYGRAEAKTWPELRKAMKKKLRSASAQDLAELPANPNA